MDTETRTRSVEKSERATNATLAVARFEGERRLRTTGVLVAVFVLFGAMFVALAPNLVATGAYDDIIASMPPALNALLGFEDFSSVEGFLSGEYYTFTWVVGLGAYLAYSAAGSVAGDLKRDRMDTLLAAPVSRTSVLLGKYLSLLVPVAVLNVVVPLALYAGTVLIDDPVPLTGLAVLHALSIPYLLCWGAVGLLLGVVVRRGRTAGRAALGAVLAAWLVEAFVVGTDVEWLRALSPMRYFEPSAVLVDGTYDVAGAGLLLAVAVACVILARARFVRADL